MVMIAIIAVTEMVTAAPLSFEEGRVGNLNHKSVSNTSTPSNTAMSQESILYSTHLTFAPPTSTPAVTMPAMVSIFPEVMPGPREVMVANWRYPDNSAEV